MSLLAVLLVLAAILMLARWTTRHDRLFRPDVPLGGPPHDRERERQLADLRALRSYGEVPPPLR